MPVDLANAFVVLGEIPKNRRETIRVTRERYKGRDLVNLRVWFGAEDGALRPGNAGLAFGRDKLNAVIEALEKARGVPAHAD